VLGILIDAAVLIFLVAAVNDKEQVELWKAALLGVAMSFVISVIVAFTASAGGMLGVILALIPAGGAAGLVAWVFLGLTLGRAMAVGGLFLLAVIGRVFLFAWMFSTA